MSKALHCVHCGYTPETGIRYLKPRVRPTSSENPHDYSDDGVRCSNGECYLSQHVFSLCHWNRRIGPQPSVWDEVDAFLEKHEVQYKMSMGLEFSSIVDWVAEFVPRRGHNLCRTYNGPWQAQDINRDDALREAMKHCEEMLKEGSHT